MKFIITMHQKVEAFKAQALSCLKRKEGQNTIEYILMLGVIVGVALLAGTLIKAMMPDVFESVKNKILGGVDSME